MTTLYEEKETWYTSKPRNDMWHFTPVTAQEFYRDIFPVGTFEPCMGWHPPKDYPHTGKGNGIIVYTEHTKDGAGHDIKKTKTRMVFDDLDKLYELQEADTPFMAPVSFFGRNRTLKNSRFMYALTIDLDDVGAKQSETFWNWYVFGQRVARPTYVVNSGGGVHLYYVFENPVPMIPRNRRALKTLKYAMTERIWNPDNSRKQEPQYQSLVQGFRLVGAKTKNGERVTAYRTGPRVTVEHMADFFKATGTAETDLSFQMWHSWTPLDVAKEKWPEWYQERVIQKRKKLSWTNNRTLYYWWLRQANKATEGHRYWYIVCLSIYAIKCGVPAEEVRRDAYGLQELMNNIAPENPFTDEDIDAALKNKYDEEKGDEFKSFPRDEIERLSAIKIPRNRRNGRKQEQHLKIARYTQSIMNDHWRNTNGRPSLENIVRGYMVEHPDARKCDVIRETGLSKKTVYKYYDDIKELIASTSC